MHIGIFYRFCFVKKIRAKSRSHSPLSVLLQCFKLLLFHDASVIYLNMFLQSDFTVLRYAIRILINQLFIYYQHYHHMLIIEDLKKTSFNRTIKVSNSNDLFTPYFQCIDTKLKCKSETKSISSGMTVDSFLSFFL